jgi:hypothetical protein
MARRGEFQIILSHFREERGFKLIESVAHVHAFASTFSNPLTSCKASSISTVFRPQVPTSKEVNDQRVTTWPLIVVV